MKLRDWLRGRSASARVTRPRLDALRDAFDKYDIATHGGFFFESPDVYGPLQTNIVVAARALLDNIEKESGE